MRTILLAGLGALIAAATHGADVYRWTDDAGRVHLSDSVPPKYKARAVRIDTRRFEQTPEQRREAEVRLARERLVLAASAPTAPGSRAPPGAGAAASAPETDCETLHRQYRESLECFAPFVTGNGTLKPNAFAACRPVVDPSPKCGLPKAN